LQNPDLKNLSNLLLATVFISTSGVLGKYIALPTEIIIWFRASLAMVFLYDMFTVPTKKSIYASTQKKNTFLFL
jgi:hypothetical protein